MGIPDHLTCLLRYLYVGQEATVRTVHGTMDWQIPNWEIGIPNWEGSSKLGKEYIMAVYCHPACLTYMQSTSCEMPGWMKLKLESRSPGEISITSDMLMTPP